MGEGDTRKNSQQQRHAYNAGDKTISLKSSSIDEFKALQNVFGEIYLEVEAESEDNSMLPIGLLLFVGDSKINGRVLWDNGSVAVEAFNLPIIFHNQDNKKSFVYNIDSSGSYEADNLPSGLYTITSGDINARYELMGSAELGSSDNLVLEHKLIDYRNFNVGNGSSISLTKTVSSTAGRSVYKISSALTEERKRLTNRVRATADVKLNAYTPIGDTNCYKDDITGAFQVVSAFDNLTKSICKDNITVDNGTELLGVTVTVRTTENISSKGQVFNAFQDVWGFSFNVGTISFKEKGSVAKDNSCLDDFGVAGNSLLRFDYCVNLKKLAVNDNFTIPFTLYAQDKGDASLATDVTIQTTLGCNYIKEFTQHENPKMILNEANRDVFLSSPRLTRDFPAVDKDETPTISFIVDNRSKVFYDNVKVPIKLQYKMDNDSEIIDSNLYLVLGNNRTLIMDNFTGKFPPGSMSIADDNVTYTLEWNNFTFPVIPKSIYNNVVDIEGNDNATIRLEAGITFISKRSYEPSPTYGTSVYSTKDGYMTLVPLFELRDIYIDNLTDIDNRKYGGLPDIYENSKGGDLWGRKAFLQWVMDDGKLIFNDISSIHGARYEKPTARGGTVNLSILGHSSHTSGTEIDVRYANPIAATGNTDNISRTYCELDLTKNSFVYTKDKKYSGYNSKEVIAALSDEAKEELDNTSMKVKPNLNDFKDWIKTNRLMMEYYYDLFSDDGKYPKVFYGKGLKEEADEGFFNMMHNGTFYDNNTVVAVQWDNSTRSKIQPQKEHYHHWHITAPIGIVKRDNVCAE